MIRTTGHPHGGAVGMAFLFAAAVLATGCSEETTEPVPGNAPQIEVRIPELMQDGYVLTNPVDNDEFHLIDKKGNPLHTWRIPSELRFDATLLPDGRVLAGLAEPAGNDETGFDGGRIVLIDPDGTLAWDFRWSTPVAVSHHDLLMLPDGHVLFLSSQELSPAEAAALGFDGGTRLASESVIEVDPATDTVVWAWHIADHNIQDIDHQLSNFGDPAQHPELIDINYGVPRDPASGAIYHCNGLEYDAARDLVFLSCNNYSEVWVIDHSTTTAEAAGHTGGNRGKGGDLVYRFGNPRAWSNLAAPRRFWTQHHPNFIPPGRPGAGHMLIFMNGSEEERSIVYELELPANLALQPHGDNEPTVVWQWTRDDFYGHHLGSAQRLPNGNTLIAEGDYGYWEITRTGQVAWKYDYEGTGIDEVPGAAVWRGYGIGKDDPALARLDLGAGGN